MPFAGPGRDSICAVQTHAVLGYSPTPASTDRPVVLKRCDQVLPGQLFCTVGLVLCACLPVAK